MEGTNKKDRKVKKESQSRGLWLVVALALFIILVGIYIYVVYYRGGEVKDGEEVNIKAGNQLSQGVVPDGFPDSFPANPRVTIKESRTEKDGEGVGIAIVFTTSDSVSEVTHYYKEELTGNGWEVTLVSENPESYTASVEKDGASGFIGIAKEINETVISVALSIK